MRHSRGWAALAAGTVIGAAGLLCHSPASAVTAGTAAADGAQPALVKLSIGESRTCTGTLIDPQWVITATACFAENGAPVGAGAPTKPTTATIGRSQPSGTDGIVSPVVRIVPHPDRGVTLVQLQLRQTGVTPLALGTAAPAVGDTLKVAGYGRTGTEWVPDRLQTAPFTVESTTSATLSLAGGTLCEGDAGAPALVETSDGVRLAGLATGSWQRGCLAVSDTREGATAARLDNLGSWVQSITTLSGFTTTFASFAGLGSYDLANTADQAVPYDYDHSGKQDHVVVYRPGSRYIAIQKHNADNTFSTVFTSTAGIAGYDLAVSTDRIVPYDYEHSGKRDYLLIYRPGSKIAYVVKHNAGNSFAIVHSSTNGIGGFDLATTADQIVAFDYEHTGRADYLLIYRPGQRIAWIIKHNADNTFSHVYTSSAGIGSYDLAVATDRAVAYDFDHSGKADHLLFYRPGSRIAFVVKHNADNTFSTVWSSFGGVAGFDLSDTRDLITPFDYEQTGRLDTLVLYRPGARRAVVATHTAANTMTAVLSSTNGIGGYDLAVATDRIAAFDAVHDTRLHGLLLYRPGSRTAFVVDRVFPAGTVTGGSPALEPGQDIVENGSYPGAARVLAERGIKLITGDGHIMLADCGPDPDQPPSDLILVQSLDQSLPAGANFCFKATGPHGYLTMEIPQVYFVRGENTRTIAAKVETHDATPVVETFQVDPREWQPLGIGQSRGDATVLELRF
jgi:hypothetical protein